MPKAVVLLSGGLDSTTALAVARARGFEVFALSVDYGQRHRVELERAAAVAKAMGAAEHRTVTLDLRAIGGSALTANLAVPKDRSPDDMGHGAPVTYVPAQHNPPVWRLGYAETLGAFDIFIGANVLDYMAIDCRPEFLAAFESLANLATKAGTEGGVSRPLAALEATKAEIIREGVKLGVDYRSRSVLRPGPAGRVRPVRLVPVAEEGFARPAPTRRPISKHAATWH